MSNLKSKIVKIMHLSTIALTLCQPALAKVTSGGGPGNGGDAVKLNGKWILLDLAEAGIEQSKNFNEDLADYYKYKLEMKSPIRGLVASRLINPSFSEFLKDGIAASLLYNGVTAANLIAAFEFYDFELTDAPLRQIGDERSTLDLEKIETVQLAIRRDNRITIYKPVFEKMDLLNQVALIMHELTYSLVIPTKDPSGYFYQESWRARSYVANQFGPSHKKLRLASIETKPGQFTFEGTNDIASITAVATHADNEETFSVIRGLPHIIVSKSEILSPVIELEGRRPTGYSKLSDAKNPTWECNSGCAFIRASMGENGIDFNADQIENAVCPTIATYPLKNHYYIVPTSAAWRLEEYLTDQGPALRPVYRNAQIKLQAFFHTWDSSPDRSACVKELHRFVDDLKSIENMNYQSFIRQVQIWK